VSRPYIKKDPWPQPYYVVVTKIKNDSYFGMDGGQATRMCYVGKYDNGYPL
jgi:hypothetical protein